MYKVFAVIILSFRKSLPVKTCHQSKGNLKLHNIVKLLGLKYINLLFKVVEDV